MRNTTILIKAGDLSKEIPIAQEAAEKSVVDGVVDMGEGFSCYWAKCNLGAEKPEHYGNYYAWGETVAKQSFDHANYKWWSSTDGFVYAYASTILKYNTDPLHGTVDLENHNRSTGIW